MRPRHAQGQAQGHAGGRAYAVAALLLVVLTACSPSARPPGEAKVDVGAQDLVAFKATTAVPGCIPGTAGAVDGGLPEVTLPCLGGGRDVDLSTLRGPLLVNLWASWCGPCRKEMPALQALHEEYGNRLGVLGIDYTDTQPGAALQLAAQSKVSYPLLADPQSLLLGRAPFGARIGLPVTAFVDADGRVVHVTQGAQSLSEFETLVSRQLGLHP